MPVELVELTHGDEVRGDGNPGGVLAEDLALGEVLTKQCVGKVPAVVEELPWVVVAHGEPWRDDLVEGCVALAPKGGAPSVVEFIEVAIAVLQPGPEASSAGVAIARGVVAAVLIGDMPQGQRWVVVISRCHFCGQARGITGEGLGRRAPGLAASGPEASTTAIDGRDFRVCRCQPHRH